MKIEIVKNKYVNAILLLMLFSASAHMLVLFLSALWQKNLYILNYFNILDLDILFPGIFKNTFAGNLTSFAAVLAIYFLIMKFQDPNGK